MEIENQLIWNHFTWGNNLNYCKCTKTPVSCCIHRYIKSADKVYLKAQDNDLEGDEESAYVYYMRYFNIICLIKKSSKYSDNKVGNEQCLNLLHPSISFYNYILLTVLYTFPMVLKGRICLTIRDFLSWWFFPLFSWPFQLIQGWYCNEKLEASHS